MGNSMKSAIATLVFHPPERSLQQWSEYKHMLHFVEYDVISGSTTSTSWQTKTSHRTCYTIISPRTKKSQNDARRFIVFSHGNASDIISMMPWARNVADTLLNVSIVLYDYEGYGQSTGQPSEQGCYRSLTMVIQDLGTRYGITGKQILLVGQSLGTGVVVDYAAETHWPYPIVLISPYKTIVSVALESSAHTPIDQFESIKKMDRLICPVKIYHGNQDRLIHPNHSEALFEKVKDKTYAPTYFQDADHNDILNYIDWRDLLPLWE